MSRSISRSTLPVLFAVGAIGIGACGSSSNHTSAYNAGSGGSTSAGGGGGALSPQQYGQQFVAAIQPLKGASAGIKANPNDPNAWDALSAAAGKAHDTITALNAPGSVASTQGPFADSIATLGTDAGKVATDLKNKDAAAVQTDKIQYAKDALSQITTYAAWAKAAQAAGVK